MTFQSLTRTITSVLGGLALLGFMGSANAATHICSGFGPGPTGNEFNDPDCDWSEIDAALGGGVLTSNDDLFLISKDDDPDNPGGGPGNNGLLEVTTTAPPTVEWTQTGGALPVIWVEKYDSIYDVYLYMGSATSPYSDSATRPDHGAICDEQGINCLAGTSHVATYSTSPVPLPAAVWLFGSALLGLAGIGRLRRRRVA